MNIIRKILRFISRCLVWLLLLPIRFYQVCISPYTPPSCRFTPTCSEYARQALLKHGPIKGLYLPSGAFFAVTLGEVRATTRCREKI